jgi:uncharacterized membrane protein (DUF4010 family)
MDELDLFFRFGIALILGILVGLQREFAFEESDEELFAGVRTFALISLLGCTGAFLSDLMHSPWPFIVLLFVVGSFITVTYFISATRGKIGLTTEVAVILTLLAGGLVYMGQIVLTVALVVTMTVLLSIKWEAKRFVSYITRDDIFAALKFAVVAAVVLPILPNEVFGPPPFDVFNPSTIWLLVVFISGISFVGYVLNKLIGPQKGIGIIGFLGGLVSSTAVTLNFAQRSRENKLLARPFALAIIVSWTVMFSRVLVQVAVVNSNLLSFLWLPMGLSIIAGLGYCVYLYFAQRYNEEKEGMEFTNPFELLPAIQFGLLFALILFISRAAQVYFDDLGLYISSLFSGIADVNAITLSMAELSRGIGELDPRTASRAIVLATVANTFAKGIIILIGGSRTIKFVILPGFLLMIVIGVTVAFLV